MLLLYILVALFISWIWVDYYRLIDIYDRDALQYFVFAFLLGGLSVPITFFLHDLLVSPFGLALNGAPFNDLVFSLYGVAFIEELSKLLPFLLFVRLFGKQLTEPLDYLAYACTSALGFAAIENVLYFSGNGASIVFGRSILSVLLHMVCTATAVYGYLVYRFRKKGKSPVVMVTFALLAILQHGLFDFFLFQSDRSPYLVIMALLLYFTMISAFSTMLNNSINQSSFYHHKLSIHSQRVALRLLGYYLAVFGLQFLLLMSTEGVARAFGDFSLTGMSSFPIAYIASIRLSRFRIIPMRWYPLRYELPFGYVQPPAYEKRKPYFSIKGEAFNEAHINAFFEETAWMKPVSTRQWIFKPEVVQVYIEDKLFLDYDESYYLARVYAHGGHDAEWKAFMLKPKKSGKTEIGEGNPIMALLELPEHWLDVRQLKRKDLRFVHWVYLKKAG